MSQAILYFSRDPWLLWPSPISSTLRPNSLARIVSRICSIFLLLVARRPTYYIAALCSSTWTFVFDRLARGWLWHISSSWKTWNASWHNGKIYFMQRSRKSITFPPKWTRVVKLSRPQSSKGLHILFNGRQWVDQAGGGMGEGEVFFLEKQISYLVYKQVSSIFWLKRKLIVVSFPSGWGMMWNHIF